MNPDKICFIICVNNKTFLDECIIYLSRLNVPDGMEVELLTIVDAKSMLAGYREGVESTDALYKVFMHQDVFILNKNFIADTLDIFNSGDDIGMIGVAGTARMPDDFIMWSGSRVGGLYINNEIIDYSSYSYKLDQDGYKEVEAVDGLLMMLKGNTCFREELFDGWDFYDVSISEEIRREGRRLVVPEQRIPWCLHDDGKVLSMLDYDRYRKVAINEYGQTK